MFIQCFSQELKNKLLQSGFVLLSENGSFSTFENNKKIYFNFNEIDKKEFMETDKLTF